MRVCIWHNKMCLPTAVSDTLRRPCDGEIRSASADSGFVYHLQALFIDHCELWDRLPMRNGAIHNDRIMGVGTLRNSRLTCILFSLCVVSFHSSYSRAHITLLWSEVNCLNKTYWNCQARPSCSFQQHNKRYYVVESLENHCNIPHKSITSDPPRLRYIIIPISSRTSNWGQGHRYSIMYPRPTHRTSWKQSLYQQS